MKRYLLFSGEDYYPSGGAYDFIGSFESIEDAVNALDYEKFLFLMEEQKFLLH